MNTDLIAVKPDVRRAHFGTLPDGRTVEAIHMAAETVRATVLTYGATLQCLETPDRHGRWDDVVLGHDDLAPYVDRPNYLGVTVGRFANRIRDGRFKLDGVSHQLTCNDGRQSLHGGCGGFDKRLWMLEETGADDVAAFVRLGLVSPHGDQGYPGELRVAVTFRLTSAGELIIDYEARSDRPTVVSLTNHALFNLSGARTLRSALDHELTLAADAFTPVDARLIPTGEIRPVIGTVFDFTQARPLGRSARDSREPQILIGRGYDHNFALRGGRSPDPKPAARLYDPLSGRGLDLATTEPGVQLYTGNFLDGTLAGKHGQLYRQGDGIALEMQTFPDAPNRPEYPSARLDPGQVYRQTTVHRFFAA